MRRLSWFLIMSTTAFWITFWSICLFPPVYVFAQPPTPILPQLTVNTVYATDCPGTGTIRAAHTQLQFTAALSAAVPGDTIVLDAGTTYQAANQLNAKVNPLNKFICIISNQLASLPEGTRVSIASAAHMPKLQTPNVAAVFQINGGASYWRFSGLEITSNSNYPTGCGAGGTTPNCMSYFLIGSQSHPTPLPSHFTVDRCYIHGSPVNDMQTAIQGTATYYAVVDSYISDVHIKGFDNQAFGASNTTGPIKIVNNYLEAAGENILFGGGGGNTNAGVPSDITITNNTIFKPLSWVPLSLSPINSMVVKNAFECKSCARVLFDSNVVQNVWAAGQLGYAVVLTVRSGQSGDFAVVNDITISNNTLLNVTSFVNTLGADDTCGISPYTACTNAGSQTRWKIYNNYVTFYDPKIQGGARNAMIAFAAGLNRPGGNLCGYMRDVLFQHNTAITAPSTPNIFAAVFVNMPGAGCTPAAHLTDNIWILDNVLPRQLTGDNGYTGMTAVNTYLPWPNTAPNSVQERYCGNVQYGQGGTIYTWPTCASTSAPTTATNTVFQFNSSGVITVPAITATVGPPAPPKQPGYLGSALPPPSLVSIAVTPPTPTIAHPNTLQYTAIGTNSDGSQVNLTSIATWASSNTGVATIIPGGLLTTVAAGTTNITATSSGISNNPPDLTTVTASGPSLVSITVTPTNRSIAPLATQQFTATGTYSDSSTANITNSVTWTSSVVGVATINTTGLATAVGSGSTVITATLGLVSGHTNLGVLGPCLGATGEIFGFLASLYVVSMSIKWLRQQKN